MKSIVHTDLIFILPWTKYDSRFTPFGAGSQQAMWKVQR